MNLKDLQQKWHDTPEFHKEIHDTFCQLTMNDPVMGEHRRWVKENIFGFGEDSFPYLWKLLLDELPQHPALLEIGVFRGQIVSLWKLLRPDAHVFGVTLLDSSGGVWESDYEADLKTIHNRFNLPMPHIFKGKSDDAEIIKKVANLLYDVVYVDGSHTYEDALNDFWNYAPFIKKGGYLVIDDAACEYSMPWGFFQGIKEVTDAKQKFLIENKMTFEFVCSVVHLVVYRKI